MRRAAVLIGMFACGSPDGESLPDTARPTPGKETRVFDVKSSDDLIALRSEYLRLWDAGWDGTLEVQIAAGDYAPVEWGLEPASDDGRAPTIDVVLRGAPSAPPAPSAIVARRLRLENLILTRAHQPWRLVVSESFAMARSLVIDGRGPHRQGRWLSILGRGPVGGDKPAPVTGEIRGSWFVRNQQASDPAAMLSFGSVDSAPAFWDSIRIDDSVFLADAFATELDFQYARNVRISRSVFVGDWPDAVLISSASSGEVVLDGSVVVVGRAEQVARHGAESPPIIMSGGSRLYVSGWQAGASAPAALAADPRQIRARSEIAASEATIAEAAAVPAGALPPPDLKARLDRALRP
jgi:hypothetical protein